jgi:hypothetical protein
MPGWLYAVDQGATNVQPDGLAQLDGSQHRTKEPEEKTMQFGGWFTH